MDGINSTDLKYSKRKWCVKDDVVISGMSGRFPKSRNVQEFTENLFNGIDMSTSGNERFPSGISGFPMSSGKVENLEDFDANFFKIPDKYADWMDPPKRKLLEVSFEAVIDAGIEIEELQGSNTGFFYASSFELGKVDDPYHDATPYQNDVAIVSQALGLKGPIAQFDTACGSSFSALNEAFAALKSGLCDRALVASYNICLLPGVTLRFRDVQMISASGKSKSLDESADGFGRSEAVCCIVLQLKPEARRIYSTIINSRTNCDGYKEQGITFPSMTSQLQLMIETYDEVDLDPLKVDYVEAHATGTKAGDPVELNAIYHALCQQRSAENPLKIGCLKSNMGHAEASAGLCAVIKANLVFQNGCIPPNLHLKRPNPNIKGLMDGKMKSVVEITPFTGEYISLNCFGFGGANAHVILKGYNIKSEPANFLNHDGLPRLVPLCARTTGGIIRIQKFLLDNQEFLTREFIGLLYRFSKTASMPYRGYTLISQIGDRRFFHEYFLNTHSQAPKTVTLVLPTHHIKFDSDFHHIQIFSCTLRRLATYSESFGIDLPSLIFGRSSPTSMKEEVVARISSQILFINLLKAIKLSITTLISDYFGLLAYASMMNIISEERAISAAYWLGHFIDGEAIISEPIEFTSSTSIKGDLNNNQTDSIIENSQRIRNSFAMMSRCLLIFCEKNQSSSLHKCEDLIRFVKDYSDDSRNGKQRGFISSSVLTERISTFLKNHSRSMNQVIDHLPPNEIILGFKSSEIVSSHLRKIQFNDLSHLQVQEFLKSVGKLYAMHLPIEVRFLYPPVEYPVPINTCGLHSLINFDHSQKHAVFKYPDYFNHFTRENFRVFQVSLNDTRDYFFSGHEIDGRVLFPATGILMHAWLTVAKFHHINLRRSKILFRDVQFIRATLISDKEVNFRVDYQPQDNSFHTTEKGALIATGKVFIVDDIEGAKENYLSKESEEQSKFSEEKSSHLEISREDIYKDFRTRGYDYGHSFRCLVSADKYGRKGKVEWKDVSSEALWNDSVFERMFRSELGFLKTWTTFADSVMQIARLSTGYDRNLVVPISIETILIDAEQIIQRMNEFNELKDIGKDKKAIQNEEIKNSQSTEGAKEGQISQESSIIFDVSHDPQTRTLISEGLWIRGLKGSIASRRSQKVNIETQDFVPFNEQILMKQGERKKLESYRKICEQYVDLIRRRVSTGIERLHDSEELDQMKRDFACEKDPSYALLKCLVNILDKNERDADTLAISGDILVGNNLHHSSHDRFLRSLLTTALNDHLYYGQMHSSIIILEQNDGEHSFFEKTKYILDSLAVGTAKLSYTLATSNLDHGTERIKSMELNLIEWNGMSPLAKDIAKPHLLIYKCYSDDISSFCIKAEQFINTIKSGGFLLVIFREKVTKDIEKICSIPQLAPVLADIQTSCINGEDIVGYMNKLNWKCVSDKILEPELLSIRGLLFKKKAVDIQEPRLFYVSPLDSQWIEELKIALKEEESSDPICLIGDPNFDQAVVGFTRCLGLESGGDRIICIANRYCDAGLDFKDPDWKNLHLKEIIEKRLKFNIYDPIHGWGNYCHSEVEEKREEDTQCLMETSNDVQLKVLQPGDLSCLKWCESIFDESLIRCSQSIVDVHYAPLNFKDVLLASGRLPLVFEPQETGKISKASVKIGFEYSGCDKNGNRIMGMRSSGAMATKVIADENDFSWLVPDEWTLEDAATVPVVYATVIYGLIMRGNLRRGESVLIHAGSGGVGMAAIHLCLSYDCTIYTTVGTPEKRKFILERFPQLKDTNIGNSRDTSFEELIFHQTDGRGVDIVLNSLADDKLQASIRCLAPGGRFLEIGKYDGYKNSPLDIGQLDGSRSFHGVMLDSFFNQENREVVKKNSQRNQLHSLMEKFLRGGTIKPLPRIVFEMDEVEDAFRYMAAGKHIGKVIIKVRDSEKFTQLTPIPALKSACFHPNKAYIVIGGFGGLGLELSQWLVSKGVRNIAINSRSGPQTSYQRYCLNRMIDSNANVIVSQHDLTTEEGARKLLSSLHVPVGGIFNSALVLHDALFQDQTVEYFPQVCDSKVKITMNMDKLSREMCSDLDYFVVFSSTTSGRGNAGQTIYGLANSFMESVCERRRKDGLHGLAIQWGYIGDVGFVVEKMGNDIQSIRGTDPQRVHSCFATFERFLNYSNPVVLSMVRCEGKTIKSSGDIIKAIGHILGIEDIRSCDPKFSLGELGMDSLMAIEVQQALDHGLGVTLTTREIRQLKICELIALSKNSNSSVKPGSESKDADLSKMMESNSIPTEEITKLSDREGEVLFVLPPIEGNYQWFGDLFSNLEQSALGLNWTYDLAELKTIEEVANVLADRISNFTSESKINMVGYSYGGILALAIAKELEKRESGPKVAKLVLLDADAQFVRTQVIKLGSSHLSSEAVIEETYIKGCLKRYLRDTFGFDKEFVRATTTSERFEAAKNFMVSKGFEPPHADSMMKRNEVTLQKLNLIAKHEVSTLPSCEIIHLRSEEKFSSHQNIERDTSIGRQYFYSGNHDNFVCNNLKEISRKIRDFIDL